MTPSVQTSSFHGKFIVQVTSNPWLPGRPTAFALTTPIQPYLCVSAFSLSVRPLRTEGPPSKRGFFLCCTQRNSVGALEDVQPMNCLFLMEALKYLWWVFLGDLCCSPHMKSSWRPRSVGRALSDWLTPCDYFQRTGTRPYAPRIPRTGNLRRFFPIFGSFRQCKETMV